MRITHLYLPISHFNPFVVRVAGDPIGITPQVGPNCCCCKFLLSTTPPNSYYLCYSPSKSS